MSSNGLSLIFSSIFDIKEEKEGHDIEADDDGLLDLSQPPEVTPPEVKKSQLFSSPKVFDKVDNNAIQVRNKTHLVIVNGNIYLKKFSTSPNMLGNFYNSLPVRSRTQLMMFLM